MSEIHWRVEIHAKGGGATDEEIQQLFNMIDKDKSGKLSLRVIILLLFFFV